MENYAQNKKEDFIDNCVNVLNILKNNPSLIRREIINKKELFSVIKGNHCSNKTRNKVKIFLEKYKHLL